MATTKLHDILSDKEKGARTARNVLTLAFRNMLKDLNIDNEKFNILLEVYLRDTTRDGFSNNQTKLANDRGNLKKEVEKDEYSIKVFLKLMRLLRLRNFSISFHGTFHDGYSLNNGKGLTYNIDLSVPDDIDEMTLSKDFVDGFYEEMDKSLEDKGEVT